MLRPRLVAAVVLAAAAGSAAADAFAEYALADTFQLPAGATEFGILPDGRLLTLSGAALYVEDAAGARTFGQVGTLPGADIASFGPAFVKVSPDGTRLAVGNNGGASFGDYQVGVFDVNTLTGQWLQANHFDAQWYDNARLALTAGVFGQPAEVTLLDVGSADPAHPDNPVIVANVGGASGGVAFDAAGNLYTGNGYATSGPSGTGAVKAFDHAAWSAALLGGPLDFESDGTLIVDVLSGNALGFDAEGNLHVAGGDFGIGQFDYAALIRSSAVEFALAGGGPADPLDPAQVRPFDPDALNDFNFYDVDFNPSTGELYLREGATVYAYIVPEPSSLVLVLLGAAVTVRRRCSRAAGRRSARTSFVLATALGPLAAQADSPFATTVLVYDPAPGQFVNVEAFNDPTRALGAPVGGGTITQGNTSVVSLGGFGGTITLGFDHTVRDDPRNPMGLDAIVFGNAHWVGGDPNRRWAEAAAIEISRDLNGNGLPDDPWYLIPGSHLMGTPPPTHTQTWDDNVGDAAWPPSNPVWIPPGHSGTWTSSGYRLPASVFDVTVLENPNGPGATVEGVYGYGDCSPTLILGDTDGDNVADDTSLAPADFYTVPDDPLTVGVTPGSGGGDAFDIGWAVDPATGEPAGLDGFDYIRLTTGANYVAGIFGELSAEIDAVADVRALPWGDADGDGDVDLADLAALLDCLAGPDVAAPLEPCGAFRDAGDVDVDLADYARFQQVFGGTG